MVRGGEITIDEIYDHSSCGNMCIGTLGPGEYRDGWLGPALRLPRLSNNATSKTTSN